MNILHITTGANYAVTTDYIRFVADNFNISDHVFLIIDKRENVPVELSERANVRIIDTEQGKCFHNILSYMKNSELIIMHSLCLTIHQQILLLFNLSILNKIVWVAWGMDLYQWKRENNCMSYKVRNLIAYLFRKKIKYFVGIFPPDIDYFKKTFKSNARTFYASYVEGLYNPLYLKELSLLSLDDKRADSSCINIQIGHSCSQILNHIQVLKDLYKFKNENIKIYIPLNYGDMEYGNQVELYAKNLFGEKVVCIRKMMVKEEYMDFLSTIDIAIFNTPRQIGLGNISPLLFMEKKVFMPAGSVMYDYYKSLGINVCEYQQVVNLNFAAFTEPIGMKYAKQYIRSEAIDKEKKIDMWCKVFNSQIR